MQGGNLISEEAKINGVAKRGKIMALAAWRKA